MWIGVPSEAAISRPEWYDEAPPVGDFLGPNGDVMFLFPGSGQLNLFELNVPLVLFMKELCEYFRVNIDIKINMIVMRENDLKKELYIEIPFWYSPFIFCDYILIAKECQE